MTAAPLGLFRELHEVNMQSHDRNWVEYFAGVGHQVVTPLAAGMEGAVYRLGGGLIGKVWGRRGIAELTSLQEFYDDITAARLPFATPQILDVLKVERTSVTIERELPGRPLKQAVSRRPGNQLLAEDAVVEVLHALATVPASATMHRLAVLDEQQPLWNGADLLRAAVAPVGFEYVHGRLLELVDRQTSRPLSVVHGDLCAENILVDDDLRPVALLDFGFLSTVGDPAFDASVAAGILDMYGPAAREVDDRLTARIAREFGYPVELLLLYRVAYSIATANAYALDGDDGHFAWCAQVLQRDDILEVLDMPAI
ncbi:phosphotransferase family protein [Kitasatospora cystarginea]|uniref:phosphotransferase family protein n=1 Tax=Kitasatospora cystarginea TaxID=58350 RepID=UPI0031D5781C